MTDFTSSVAFALTANFRDFVTRVHDLASPLSEEQFWRKPYPYGNSFGHLVLHLTGNLNYYIGARIAGTGYVRDRPREFNDPSKQPKAEVLQKLDEAVDMVIDTIEKQTSETWTRAYTAEGSLDLAPDRYGIMQRCAVHFFHHLGQMIYLQREWTVRG